MLKDKTFTYRGHTFQVRASLSEEGWTVQVYENERPISPPYKVTHETATNFATAGWVTPLKLSWELDALRDAKSESLTRRDMVGYRLVSCFMRGQNSRN